MNWSRARSTAFAVTFCFCLGFCQRQWSRFLARQAERRRHEDPLNELARRLEQDRLRLERSLDDLPPDAQSFFKGVFYDARAELVTSPLIASLQRMAFSPRAGDEEPAQAARSRYEAFEHAQAWAGWLLWILGLGAAGWCLAAALAGRPHAALSATVNALFYARLWLFALSGLCALWSGLTLRNLWAAMPLAFYAAPAAVAAAGLLVNRSEQANDSVFERCVAAGEAPLVALVWALVARGLA